MNTWENDDGATVPACAVARQHGSWVALSCDQQMLAAPLDARGPSMGGLGHTAGVQHFATQDAVTLRVVLPRLHQPNCASPQQGSTHALTSRARPECAASPSSNTRCVAAALAVPCSHHKAELNASLNKRKQ